MNCFKYRNCWRVLGVMAFLPVMAHGQTRIGAATITGAVSEIVALSLAPTLPQRNLQLDAHGDLKTLTLTLSGSTTEVAEIRVPILIRSNTNYKVSALVQSQAATLAKFIVVEARPSGRFVASDALPNLNVASELDSRATDGQVRTTSLNSSPLSLSAPLSVLSGTRISLAGTLNSVDNALEVIILIAVKPDTGAKNWLLSLDLSGSAAGKF